MAKLTKPRTLVTTGVFAALYLIAQAIGGSLAMFGPIMIPIGSLIGAFAGGVVMMVYLAKTRAFGSFTVMGVIAGVLLAFTGHIWWAFLIGFLTGLIGDGIAVTKGYASPVMNSLAYAVFSLWQVAPAAPLAFHSQARIDAITARHDAAYAAHVAAIFSPGMLVVLAIATFAVSLVAGLFGYTIIAKHFVSSGLVGGDRG